MDLSRSAAFDHGRLTSRPVSYGILNTFCCVKRGGVEVEHQTPNREVLGSIPKGGTVLCSCARHINSLQYWLNPGSVVSDMTEKSVDWDIKLNLNTDKQDKGPTGILNIYTTLRHVSRCSKRLEKNT